MKVNNLYIPSMTPCEYGYCLYKGWTRQGIYKMSGETLISVDSEGSIIEPELLGDKEKFFNTWLISQVE